MNWYEIAGIAAAGYVVVGLLAWALMKAASGADDVMENWSKEEFHVHDD